MARFLDVSPAGSDPVVIDIDNIRLVEVGAEKIGFFADADTLICRFSKGDNKATEAVLSRIEEKDKGKWLRFPVRWAENGNYDDQRLRSRYLVRADTVTSVSVSESRDLDGHGASRAMVLDVEGFYRLESQAVTEQEGQDILEALDAAAPDFFRVEPKEAYSHFSNAGYTLYDPAKLNRIESHGFGNISLYFRGGSKLGFTLAALAQESAKGYDMTGQMFAGPLCQKEPALKKDFARALAAKTPELEEVENTLQPLFLRFNEVASVFVWSDEKGMNIYHKGPKLQVSDVMFNSSKDCRAALRKLSGFSP